MGTDKNIKLHIVTDIKVTSKQIHNKMDKICGVDLSINYYEILGVPRDANEKDILRGYRRKALTCHPDKNPDNPKAALLFIQLSKAVEILTDTTARDALDKVLKGKDAARQRTQAYDT